MVSSRGRKEFDRFVLGSIAENLLFQSHLPVIFLTHQHEPLKHISQNNILFSTDFSNHSEKAFEITLPISTIATDNVVIPDNYISSQETWAREELEKWVDKVKTIGIYATSF